MSRIRVEVISPDTWDEEDVTRTIVCDGLQAKVARHLNGSPEHFRESDLVMDFDYESHQSEHHFASKLVVSVTGTVNGESFSQTLERRTNRSTDGGDNAVLMTSGIAGLALKKAAGKAWEATGGADWEKEKMESHLGGRLRDDLLFELLSGLDKAVGRPASGYSRALKVIVGVSFGVFLVGTVLTKVVLARGAADQSLDGWGLLPLGFSAMVALPVFVGAVAFGLITLPASFFETETLGKKLIAFTGARSARSIKPVCACLGIAFIGLTVGLVYLFTSSGR